MNTRYFPSVLAALAVLVVSGSRVQADSTFITLDGPGATNTWINGISGSVVYGAYADATGHHGFTYEGGVFTTVDHPNAMGVTSIGGVSGSTIVGFYRNAGDHSFIYEGGVFTPLDYPGATSTWVDGIYGSTISGNFTGAGGTNGFIYEGGVFTTLKYPGREGVTGVYGISGSTLVGTSLGQVFTYEGGVFSSLWEVPGATPNTTEGWGIFGSTIVGCYNNPGPWPNLSSVGHGFIKTGDVYTTLDYPGATATRVSGISDFGAVGFYRDDAGAMHGFIATFDSANPVPLPAAVWSGAALLVTSGVISRLRRRKCASII